MFSDQIEDHMQKCRHFGTTRKVGLKFGKKNKVKLSSFQHYGLANEKGKPENAYYSCRFFLNAVRFQGFGRHLGLADHSPRFHAAALNPAS